MREGGESMEQATGIEPALKAWEALILPLNYACANGRFINNVAL